MTDRKVIQLVSKKLDEKFLNSKYQRFSNYARSKRKILKEIRISLEYVLVCYLEAIEVKVIDVMDINRIAIYLNFTDKTLNKKVTIYYECKGDND